MYSIHPLPYIFTVYKTHPHTEDRLYFHTLLLVILSRYYAAAGIWRHENEKQIFYLKYINPTAEFIVPHRSTVRYTNANTYFKHVHNTVSHVTGGPFSYSSEMRSSRSIPNQFSVVMLLCTDKVGVVPSLCIAL